MGNIVIVCMLLWFAFVIFTLLKKLLTYLLTYLNKGCGC